MGRVSLRYSVGMGSIVHRPRPERWSAPRRILARAALAPLLLAGALCGRSSAQAAPTPPAKADSSGPAWTALEQEFIAASRVHEAALKKAKDERLPPDRWPKSPANEFWDRCESFARTGEPDAVRWCIAFLDDLDLAPGAMAVRRLELYRAWVQAFPNGAAIQEVLRGLQSDASPGRLGVDPAAALCSDVARISSQDEIRAAATLTQAMILLGSKDSERTTRARVLFSEVVEKHPRSESAPRAKGKLFSIDNLQIGKPCPDFTAKDVAGVEFKLSDYRGKVVVLDFWGFW